MSNMIMQGRYKDAFEIMQSKGVDITLDNIINLFKDTNAFSIYVFIEYIIECEPSSKAHLAAASCLLFSGMNIDGEYILARRHLLCALEINPSDIEVYEFIMNHFIDCPDNTFSADEIDRIISAYKKLDK